MGIVFGRQHKIIGLPSRGKGNPYPTIRQVVHYRPFFRYTDGVLQWQDHTPRPDLDIFRDRGYRGADHGRVRVESPEGVKMPLRSPDRRKTVLVGELCAFHEQTILVLPGFPRIAGKIKQAEVHWLYRAASVGLIHIQNDLETSCQRPEEFEHRNIKGETGHRQPDIADLVLDPFIHAREEVDDVAVFDHNPLRLARRTRRVNEIGQVVRSNFDFEVFVTGVCNRWPVAVEENQLALVVGKLVAKMAVRQKHGEGRVFQHEIQPIPGIGWVQGDIGATRFENRQNGDDHVEGTLGTYADLLFGTHAQLLQVSGKLVCTSIQLSVGQLLVLKYHRNGSRLFCSLAPRKADECTFP